MTDELTRADYNSSVEADTLLTELSRVAERKSRLNRWSRPLIVFCALFQGVYGLLIQLLHLPFPQHYKGTFDALYHVALGVMFASFIPDYFAWKRLKESRGRVAMLVRKLSTDPRAVGAIAQLCRPIQYLTVAEIAIPALVELLPSVKASDARYVTDAQMDALLSLLILRNQGVEKSKYSQELPLAVLKALEQIGDSRAIDSVKRLVAGDAERPYHQAAQECLAVLEQHGEERNRNRSLLLPSSLDTGPKTLLRAATWTEDTQPEQLLRATTGEERE